LTLARLVAAVVAAPGRPLWAGRVDRYVGDGELLSVAQPSGLGKTS
jgi:hypothetical protein